jgi:hypothetical protein
VYFVNGRSLNSSRKSEFGDSGQCRISTSDVSKIAANRPLQKCDSARTPHIRPWCARASRRSRILLTGSKRPFERLDKCAPAERRPDNPGLLYGPTNDRMLGNHAFNACQSPVIIINSYPGAGARLITVRWPNTPPCYFRCHQRRSLHVCLRTGPTEYRSHERAT